LGDAKVVQQFEQLPDVHIVLRHAVVILVGVGTRKVLVIVLHVRAEVHPRGVPPAEERLVRIFLPRNEFLGRGQRFFVDRLHPLFRERTGVFDRLSSLAIGLALQYAARTELLAKRFAIRKHKVPRIVAVLRFLLGVQVIKIA
jgi:hypothetical protein